LFAFSEPEVAEALKLVVEDPENVPVKAD
jgi:hypothetical protein